MTPGLESCYALVLNADFRPLSYFPLSIWSWQDAVKAVFLDRVSVISEYERKIHSPSFEMRLPSVIALKEYVPAARRPAFTRFNVFLRDHFNCQYCRGDFATNELTFDHVRLQPVQSAEGQPAVARERHAPAPLSVGTDDAGAAGERPCLPARLPARELARLPVLGQRARAVLVKGARHSSGAFMSATLARGYPRAVARSYDQILVDSQIANREPALMAAVRTS